MPGKTYSLRVEFESTNSTGAIWTGSIGEAIRPATTSATATTTVGGRVEGTQQVVGGGGVAPAPAPRTKIGSLYFPHASAGVVGFGGLEVNAAAFQEYFLASGTVPPPPPHPQANPHEGCTRFQA
jgi:hypothetical protein